MDTLYWVLGSGAGLTALLLYMRHLLNQKAKLEHQNAILKTTEEYQSEVIKQLSKPKSIDDTVDSLHKGEF